MERTIVSSRFRNNKATINNNFINFLKMRTTRPSKAWITLKEFPRFTKVAIWITQTSTYREDLILLSKRITALVKHNGFNWTFIYLKESMRLVVRYLAGTPDKLCTTKVRVRLDSQGLPVIIPFPIRRVLTLDSENSNVTRATMTLLSIFRVFPTKVKPDFSSITGVFTGLSPTLEIAELSRQFTSGFRFRITKIKGFISESAGPNSNKATAGAAIDALALLHNPKQLRAVYSVLFRCSSWSYMLSLTFILMFGLPVYLIQLVGLSPVPHMGRLSVVYDQAGKARVVALTNYWTQLCLKPLHNSIFEFLKSLETDGTFNQDAPITRLLSLNLSDKFSCFDLSSATDRLPMQLQVDILNGHEAGLGDIWNRLLDFNWFYNKKLFKYAVGQPMGAYSSWAMLALTHHLIIQLAAKRLGYREFSAYAVLGDDVVIQDDDISVEYLSIMKALGVGINMSKTVVSTELLEFAKRLRTRTLDVSPIGPGAILATSRRPLMAATLFSDLNQRSLLTFSDAFKMYLKTFPFKVKRIGIVLSVFGIRGQLESLHQLDVETLSWIVGVEIIDPNLFIGALKEHAVAAALAETDKAVINAQVEEYLFYRNAYRLAATKTVLQDYFSVLTLLVSPMFWLYLESFIRSTEQAKAAQENLLSSIANDDLDSILVTLFKQDLSNISIAWNVKAHRSYANKVKALSANTLCSMINEYYRSRGIAQKANFSKIHKGL
jgi:hypothetical protein